MAYILDEIEFYIRENVGFEKEKGSFERLRKKFLEDLKHTKGFIDLLKLKRNYLKLFKSIETDKPKNPIRIGVLGELYVLMEPFSNYFIEKELAQKGIQVTRFMNITYLLFEKAKLEKKLLKNAGKYLKYPIGADGTDSVARTKILAELGFDGIIHIKPFGCTPEVNAIPILQNLSNDYKIPILYFSFDAHTSETGVKTRLEAFYDMLLMRKEKRYD